MTNNRHRRLAGHRRIHRPGPDARAVRGDHEPAHAVDRDAASPTAGAARSPAATGRARRAGRGTAPGNGRISAHRCADRLALDQGRSEGCARTAARHERCINITYVDHEGESYAETSVPLLQDQDPRPQGGYFCEWMPYQKQVASGQQAPVVHALKSELSE